MVDFQFNFDDGNCASDWRNWLRGFELFAKANRMENTTTKKHWLLHYAGPKVQDVYFNLPKPTEDQTAETRHGPLAGGYVPFPKDPYDEVVDVLLYKDSSHQRKTLHSSGMFFAKQTRKRMNASTHM